MAIKVFIDMGSLNFDRCENMKVSFLTEEKNRGGILCYGLTNSIMD
jgi:hypothetical protein